MAAGIKDYRGTLVKYMLIFSVPILVFSSFFFYNQYFGHIENTREYNISLFNQFSQEIDLFYSQLQDVALTISRMERLPDAEGTEDDTDFVRTLRNYQENLGSNVLMLYYPRFSHSIYINGELTPYNSFEKSELYDISLSVSGLYTRLCNVTRPYYLPISSFGDNSAYSTAVLFPMPLSEENISGTLCFLVRKDFLDELYKQYFPDLDGQLLVLDIFSECIYAKEMPEENEMDMTIQALSGTKIGVSEMEINAADSIVMKNRSLKTGFSYYIIAGRTEFYEEAVQSLWLLLLIIITLLLFSFIISLIIARKYYLVLFKEHQKQSRISDALLQKTILIREMVLKKLIDGTIKDGDEADLEYNLRCANLRFRHGYYTVFMLLIDQSLSLEALNRMQHSLNTYHDDDVDVYSCQLETRDRIAIIFNHEESTDRKTMAEILNTLLQGKMPMIMAYAGGSYATPFSIDVSFIEASSIKEMSPLNSDGYRFFSREKTTDNIFRYPEQEESIISQAVRNASEETALDAVNNVFTIVCNTSSYPLARGICYDMISLVRRLSLEIRGSINDSLLDKLLSFQDYGWLKSQISLIIHDLISEVILRNEKESTETRHALVEYVQQHFTDNDISLDKLSSMFNLSFSYIGKIFKEETNSTFKGYITELRFSYVKDMLANSDAPIKEIINNAGYMDVANYMRKFKQHEGITPGQFREQTRRK